MLKFEWQEEQLNGKPKQIVNDSLSKTARAGEEISGSQGAHMAVCAVQHWFLIHMAVPSQRLSGFHSGIN
jgi:hypothetical protein